MRRLPHDVRVLEHGWRRGRCERAAESTSREQNGYARGVAHDGWRDVYSRRRVPKHPRSSPYRDAG